MRPERNRMGHFPGLHEEQSIQKAYRQGLVKELSLDSYLAPKAICP
jgi:hypothetical protein